MRASLSLSRPNSPFSSPLHHRILFPKTPLFFRLSLSTSPSPSSISLSRSSLNPDSLSTADESALPDTGDPQPPSSPVTVLGAGVEIEVLKTGKNRRRIRSRIAIDAGLDTIWALLTDYERLPDFIPGLAVSKLLDKSHNFARLFQMGQQNLAFGLKFNAKGIVDCFEKDPVLLPFGRSREIEFKMIEGDFQTFEGKWSIAQARKSFSDHPGDSEDNELSNTLEFQTLLSYEVDVEPKMWLPVGLVEGRLCKEIELNLISIREEAHRTVLEAHNSC